ncbi:MAG: hypothetical protein ACOC8E_03940 [Planctomycetota bacterium]
MNWTGLLFFMALLASSLLAGGCATVAAGVASGVLFEAGSNALDDTSRATVPAPMAEVARATRRALGTFTLCILDEDVDREDGDVARWKFETAVAGDDDVISVDVILDRVTPHLTRVRVTASRGPCSPDLATARAVVGRISDSVSELPGRPAARSLARRPPLE